ncbi:hypothetical protein EXS57_03410 [Candidatus Kaiserbacteria bacterium]|nr:hypothetical protein [Candidatus Kaiserbacteria bacterium]
MKTVSEHIEHIKGKPHHVRKNITFVIAASVTAVVALAWLVGSVSSGMFILKPTSFAEITQQKSIETVDRVTADSENLAGAAAALGVKDTSAHIQIVDTTPATPSVKKVEQTTIPF